MTAIDILLKAVTGAKHSAGKRQTQRDQATKTERNAAVQVLRQAKLTADQLVNAIVAITRDSEAAPNEKYYKIEALIIDHEAARDPDNVARLAALDDQIQRELKNVPYHELLVSLSLRLQHRVADVVRTVTFDAETSDAEFLTEQERETVHHDNGFDTSLYKSLQFFHLAASIKSGHLNLLHSYRFRAI